MPLISRFLFAWPPNTTANMVHLATFLFGAISLAIPSGYSYGPALLFLMSLFVCWRPNYWCCMSRETKIFGVILILYFLVQAISIWLDGGKLRELDRPSRVLMVAMMLPLLSRYPARQLIMLAGFAVGACIAGSIAIYEKCYLGLPRAFDNMMPIQSGNISMTLGLLSLCGYFWYKARHHNKIAMGMLLACGMGMLGSLLSGTRGGWILLPFIIISIILHFKATLCRQDGMLALIFGVIFLGLIATPQSGVLGRVEEARSDMVQYLDGGDKNTSLGIRLQLWYSALEAFKQKPIFGWGNHGIRQAELQQYKEGKISEFIYNFNSHAHNQFLDEMAKRGGIGLTILLFLYFYPLAIYSKAAKPGRIIPLMLSISALTLFDYSLSQAFINHNSGIVFFTTLFALLLTAYAKEKTISDQIDV